MFGLAAQRMQEALNELRFGIREVDPTLLAALETVSPGASRLIKRVPARYGEHAHHWLILHGRYVCTARSPRCSACAVRSWCDEGRRLPA
jgi:hypothetical protein